MKYDEVGIINDMPRGWAQHPAHAKIKGMWKLMWSRCRNPHHKHYNRYKDCSIDERWRFYHFIMKILKNNHAFKNF